jgi:hypothetical protein
MEPVWIWFLAIAVRRRLGLHPTILDWNWIEPVQIWKEQFLLLGVGLNPMGLDLK